MGRWRRSGYEHTVEGEWKDGLLSGKAVEDWFGCHAEYEAKGGKKDGKSIQSDSKGIRL